MAVVLAENKTLASFHGDATASVQEFFDVWNTELPPSLAERNIRFCNVFMETYGRTRFSHFFKLTRDQACKACDGLDGWVETIEEMAGFTFDGQTAPDSARLASLAGVDAVASCLRPTVKTFTANTIYARLVKEGTLDQQIIPDAVYAVVDVANPLVDEISAVEIERFTDALLQWFACEYGEWNIGIQLARHFGKQIEKRLPNIAPYGSVSRKWWKIVKNKTKNRRYVRRARPFEQLSRTAVHAPAFVYAQHAATYVSKLSVNKIDLTAKALSSVSFPTMVDLEEDEDVEPKYEPNMTPPGSPPAENRDENAPPNAQPQPSVRRTTAGVVVLGEVAPRLGDVPAVPTGASDTSASGASDASGASGASDASGASGASDTPEADGPPPPKRKRARASKKGESGLSDYEQKRAANIAENKRKLTELGLGDEPPKRKPKRTNPVRPPHL